MLNEAYDIHKIIDNKGTKRISIWIDGGYHEWDSKEKQLTIFGDQYVILKELYNVNTNKSWFEESKSYLTINNKWADVVQCFGLTKNPSSGNVMNKMEMDLRTYLKQKRDLHSGNLLYGGKINQSFHISDLGFCGPVDKPLNSVYGNLPYI
ncbi:kinase-like domain-containing protein [Rhizophagus irregularis DAOM 181602=DAOM 197198]|uniref:Protein kinase domain-containing protein n=1 Tax=Rhizophagus irregularis (strain DAOM 181602 / DAOM 197198 / MUCL 43194) TaxID=747089 RepID=A0A2P4P9Q5_RHIID|nr:hypothetical protein GLOIN_2v1785765 [Rhizophagus irregularis DAOM 181602=DAOM 197198]POG62101.1 hypothetical protein GLOIN_2v1785765 [Rhizophagus irregularis DAOM 181602=DAOM 197198]GET51112.1 kinase-like domain-containing protein [Rhizophagus irregularis DAOM 181602=DAOM 197198]|eukprot:XP_025168967.1 hypothetical protein GLOIN_2v1785765 [Rhizophagus irregularis DAOM 181602=DAOM 197198]